MVAVGLRNRDVLLDDYSSSVGVDHARPNRLIGAGQDLVELHVESLRVHHDQWLPASRQLETAKEKFERLANRWRKETAFQSSIHAIALHPAYQEIIGMGYQAVPLMLRALEDGPEHWFWALCAITGVDPVPSADRGDVPKMSEVWLVWGRHLGLIDRD